MLAGALLILLPLFLGFAVPLNNRTVMTAVHHSVDGLVYFILALLVLASARWKGWACNWRPWRHRWVCW